MVVVAVSADATTVDVVVVVAVSAAATTVDMVVRKMRHIKSVLIRQNNACHQLLLKISTRWRTNSQPFSIMCCHLC